MTDADHLRAEINNAIDLAERVQATKLAYEDAIDQLKAAALLLDMSADNAFSRAIGRMAPLIGTDLNKDAEITERVKTELMVWLPLI